MAELDDLLRSQKETNDLLKELIKGGGYSKDSGRISFGDIYRPSSDFDKKSFKERKEEIRKLYEEEKEIEEASLRRQRQILKEKRAQNDADLKRLEKEIERGERRIKQLEKEVELEKDAAKAAEKKAQLQKEKEDTAKKEKEYLDDLRKEKEFDRNIERTKKSFQDTLKTIKSSIDSAVSGVRSFNEAWAKADHAAASYARTIGGTAAAMEKLRKQGINTVVHSKIGIKYDMSIDELLKAQEAYSKAIGRNIMVDVTQQESIAAMSKIMGPEGANQLATAYENFGLSLNGTAKHAGRMFKEAAEAGISFDKLSQNVRDNIHIAQNYTFKNGIAGLESMAKKAAAIKMDIKQIESLANKVSTIEGSIDTAAKLQVLGGSFAAFSDPMGMLKEGLTDMEGLMDRIIKMTGGLGSFDKKTGEVRVTAFNKARIKAAADAMGMDYSQMMTQINAQAKRKEIEAQINSSSNARGLNENMKELLKNSATFENGRAGVAINGEFKSIDELTNDDFEDLKLLTQDQSADIKDIAQNLRSLLDIRSGAQKQKDANKARISERLRLGEIEKKLTDTIAHSNTLLTLYLAGGIFNGVGGWLSNLGQGLGLFGKGGLTRKIFNLFGRRGGGGNIIGGASRGGGFFNRILGFGGGGTAGGFNTRGLQRIVSNSGKTYFTNGAGQIWNAAGTRLTGQVAKNVANSGHAVGSTIFKGGIGRSVTRLATKLGGRGAGRTVGHLASFAKGARGAGILAGVTEGIFTGIDEFGSEKNYGTAKKVGRTAGSAVGAGAATAAIGAALAGTGVGLIPGLLLMAAGGLAGGSIGKWIGGGFASQERRARKKKEYGLEELQGDYSVRKLKKIEDAVETGNIEAKLRRELKKKGDTAILEKIRAAKKANGGEDAEKNIAEAYFTVENAYFGNDAGGAESKSRGKIKGAKESSGFGQAILDSAKFGPFAGLAMGVKMLSSAGEGINIRGRLEKGIGTLAKATPIGMAVDAIGKLRGGDAQAGAGNATANTTTPTSSVPSSMNINVNGTIKLTDAQGKSFDIAGQLLKDNVFIKELSLRIKEAIGWNETMTYNKDRERT